MWWRQNLTYYWLISILFHLCGSTGSTKIGNKMIAAAKFMFFLQTTKEKFAQFFDIWNILASLFCLIYLLDIFARYICSIYLLDILARYICDLWSRLATDVAVTVFQLRIDLHFWTSKYQINLDIVKNWYIRPLYLL